MSMQDLQLPPGRLIMGSVNTKDPTDYEGKPIPVDQQRYFFGIACPKSDPQTEQMWATIYQMAATEYAGVPLVMAQIQQGLAAKDFSWKIQDGDVPTYDKKTGQLREIPDYMKGCLIFKFSTLFEFGACDVDGRDINLADIKRGDYVDVVFDAAVNGKNDDTAGIYLNPRAIRRLGYGDAITGRASASAVFAGRAAQVPAGASAIPTAGGAVPPPAAAPQAAPAAPVPPTPAQAVPAAPMAAPMAPAPTATPASVPPAPAGTVPAPVAPPATSIASPSEGVPPHPGILNPPT